MINYTLTVVFIKIFIQTIIKPYSINFSTVMCRSLWEAWLYIDTKRSTFIKFQKKTLSLFCWGTKLLYLSQIKIMLMRKFWSKFFPLKNQSSRDWPEVQWFYEGQIKNKFFQNLGTPKVRKKFVFFKIELSSKFFSPFLLFSQFFFLQYFRNWFEIFFECPKFYKFCHPSEIRKITLTEKSYSAVKF